MSVYRTIIDQAKERVIRKKLNESFIEELRPDKEELSQINARLDLNHSIRNDLLKFSFTTVIASLGAALALENISAPLSFLFLFPFVVMIPFQARISYYRLEEAHLYTYISKFCQENDRYHKICTEGYYENVGIGDFSYKVIAWLINHELVCLSILTCVIFWLKFFSSKEAVSCVLIIIADILPVILLSIIWSISHSTYSFFEMRYRYSKKLNDMQDEWKNRAYQ